MAAGRAAWISAASALVSPTQAARPCSHHGTERRAAGPHLRPCFPPPPSPFLFSMNRPQGAGSGGVPGLQVQPGLGESLIGACRAVPGLLRPSLFRRFRTPWRVLSSLHEGEKPFLRHAFFYSSSLPFLSPPARFSTLSRPCPFGAASSATLAFSGLSPVRSCPFGPKPTYDRPHYRTLYRVNDNAAGFACSQEKQTLILALARHFRTYPPRPSGPAALMAAGRAAWIALRRPL